MSSSGDDTTKATTLEVTNPPSAFRPHSRPSHSRPSHSRRDGYYAVRSADAGRMQGCVFLRWEDFRRYLRRDSVFKVFTRLEDAMNYLTDDYVPSISRVGHKRTLEGGEPAKKKPRRDENDLDEAGCKNSEAVSSEEMRGMKAKVQYLEETLGRVLDRLDNHDIVLEGATLGDEREAPSDGGMHSIAPEQAGIEQPAPGTDANGEDCLCPAEATPGSTGAVESVYVTFDPFDPSTWRPDKKELPRIVTRYDFPDLTTFRALYQEYFFGRKEPPIRWVEKFFGPRRRRKKSHPSWRSQLVRGDSYDKVDFDFSQRKVLYDLFEEGMTPDDLADFVCEKDPELMKDKDNHNNGRAVQWLIDFVQGGNVVAERGREHSFGEKVVEDEAALSQAPSIHQVVKGAPQHEVDVDAFFKPFDTSTWRPMACHLPAAVKEFKFAPLTTVQSLYNEYFTGNPELGVPPVQQLEIFFGPGKRGGLPSWRSHKVHGGTRKADLQFSRRKRLYDLFDEGKSVDDVLEIVRRNEPRVLEREENLTNGSVIRWLYRYLSREKEEYAARSEAAKQAWHTRKAGKQQRGGGNISE